MRINPGRDTVNIIHQSRKRRLHALLGSGIDGTRRFVENQHRRQAEHDPRAAVFLITPDADFGKKVEVEMERQMKELSRYEIMKSSVDDYAKAFLCKDAAQCFDIVNKIAPEHLEVNVAETQLEQTVGALHNYGSLFIGGNTAEVFGDYASGTNHTLPTLGAARYTGGVWVGTFLKTCTYQSMSPQAMMDIAPLVSNLARGEGLIGHARAAEIRMEKNKK